MQRIFQAAGFLIEFRRAVAFQPATDQEFVEAIEPTQSARLAEIDELGCTGPLDGDFQPISGRHWHRPSKPVGRPYRELE